MRLNIADIRTDGGTQPRVEMNWVVIQDYATAMHSGAAFPPVTVFHDGNSYWLADGFHRLAAVNGAGEIDADVRTGTIEDARWFSYGTNKSHGLRRTNADKQAAVDAALRHPNAPTMNDGEIADHCGVDLVMVYRQRKAMEAAFEVQKLRHRQGKDGKKYPTEYKPRKPKIVPVAEAVSLFRETAAADNPSEVAALTHLAPDQQIAVAEKIAAGKADHVSDAIKDVRKDERKHRQAEKQAAALALIPVTEQTWRITDCQEVVSCHALITDPPYGITDNDWEPAKLEAFTRDWARRWDACGADLVLVFWSQEHLFTGRQWFDAELSNYHFQQLLVWHYPNNKKPQSRMGFKQTWEPILFYRRIGSDRQITPASTEWGDGLNSLDCHVAAVPQENFNDAEMKQHPTQKPVSVFRWLINATTQPGELVCDPFAGSGTSGIAATELRRRYHGIEIKENYRQMASERIALYGT